VEGLAVLVEQLRAANAGLREVIAGQARQLEAQAAQIAELRRRLEKDSSTSSKLPSSDPPYRKPARESKRSASGRKPGKQRGAPGSTMPLVDDPDEIVVCNPGCCTGCGADLAGAPVVGRSRRQVTDVTPPPPPRVTECQILTRACPGCAARSGGVGPAVAAGRAQYGPGVLARAAELLCGHCLDVLTQLFTTGAWLPPAAQPG
jgi:transposase